LGTPVGSLLDIVNVVNDTAWISNDGGVVTLSAGLILEPKTKVTISAPISKLVMEVKPGVYLGVSGASLSIKGVTVQAGDNKVPRDGEVGDGARPFVVASDLSRMDIANSRFLYLGRDWIASYGVSWVRGSTGSARETTFEKSFIGAFTANARDISFLKNTFRDNVLYGLDPHTSTTGLTVEENLAEGNGHHGIIFSDHVTNSVVRHNTVRNNKVNGIMMDYASDLNVIEGNRVVGNKGDGIVMSDSAQNRVVGNEVDKNRVGVHVYGQILRRNDFERNTVTDNVVAAQGADLAAGNVVQRNGSHWKPFAVGVTWVLTVLAGALLCLLTWRSRRQRELHVAKSNEQARRVKVGAG
jgi:poly(beta-D-mannuronate) C5 epimerase